MHQEQPLELDISLESVALVAFEEPFEWVEHGGFSLALEVGDTVAACLAGRRQPAL